MTTMHAVIQDRYGDPDVLHMAAINRPTCKNGEILVRVSAASVNGYDVLLRSGALKMLTSRKFPKQSGLDFVGRVEESDAGAPFGIGDEVWGVLPLHRLGGIAEYVAIDPRCLSRRPTSLTAIEAAALPVVGTTALAALRDVASLRPGERLLVRGASGGVGTIAVQLGKTMGARITGLASARDLASVRENGATDAVDYASADPASLGPYDVIFDTVGSDIAAWRRRLDAGGRMVAIVPEARHPLRWMAYVAYSRIYGGRRVRFFSAKPESALLAELARRVDGGEVRPTVEAVYPIDRIADAHRAFERRGGRGKQVITLD